MHNKQILVLIILVLSVLSISKIRFLEEYVNPGEDLEIFASIVNNGNKDADNVKVIAYLPETGEDIRAATFDVQDNDHKEKFLWWDVPQNMPTGDYLVKITASNDNHRSTKYRYITVE